MLATNPLQLQVLLYDGEELLGAKQNRILNVTVLVAARSETRIPVSCVEQGRWSARSASFAAAEHAAYLELRRRKAESLSADPLAPGLAQGEVWAAVRETSARHDVYSPTEAQADIFRERESDLGRLRVAFPAAPGQCGALVAIGPNRFCLDYLSRPDAFARLYPKLLDGYLLDAIEHLDERPATERELEQLLHAVGSAKRSRRPSIGLGDDLRLQGDRVVGSGLEHEGELVQLSAFASENGRPGPRTRILRPSRRR